MVDVVTTVAAFQKWPTPQKFVRPPVLLLRTEGNWSSLWWSPPIPQLNQNSYSASELEKGWGVTDAFSPSIWFYFTSVVQIISLTLNFNVAPCISTHVGTSRRLYLVRRRPKLPVVSEDLHYSNFKSEPRSRGQMELETLQRVQESARYLLHGTESGGKRNDSVGCRTHRRSTYITRQWPTIAKVSD